MAGGHGHKFADLTLHAPKRWQVLTGQGMCTVMWLWVFYRAKNDGPALLGWRHPWDDHGHGHSSGHGKAHQNAHGHSKVQHESRGGKERTSILSDQPKPREKLVQIRELIHQVGDSKPKVKETNDKRQKTPQAVDLQPSLRKEAVDPQPKLREKFHQGHKLDQESMHVQPNFKESVQEGHKSGNKVVDLHHKSRGILDEHRKSGQEAVDLQPKMGESSRQDHKSSQKDVDLQPKLKKKSDQQRKSGQEVLDVFKDKRKIERHAKVISLIEEDS